MQSRLEEEDVTELVNLIKTFNGKVKGLDKARFANLLDDIDILQRSYTPDMSIRHIINRVEDFFQESVQKYEKFVMAPGLLKGKHSYIKELNRGGGSRLDQMIGLMLRDKIYPNSKYNAVPMKLISNLDQLKGKGEEKNKKSLLRNPFRKRGP